MDEVLEFCRRVLGSGPAAEEAAAAARAAVDGESDRVKLLSAAARACRMRAEAADVPAGAAAGTAGVGGGLAGAVAAEVASAVAVLPQRQREALVLRERLRFSHAQIARVLEVEPAAVGLVLARARLGLRAQRRGTSDSDRVQCEDRDRALRLLTSRQDSEPLSGEDDDWLFEHLGECEECTRAHAAMLEASAVYRASR